MAPTTGRTLLERSPWCSDLLDAGAFVFFLYHWLALDFTAFRGASTMALGVLYVATGPLQRPRNLPLARSARHAGIAWFCVAVPLRIWDR
ncbi:MAG: hypothetical protein R3E12_11205 [Candidatus Eisenbacteria bacterium]